DARDAALPLACFNLALKQEGDGMDCALVSVLCGFAKEKGMTADCEKLVKTEWALTQALQWRINAITPSHILSELALLCPHPVLWDSLRGDVYAMLETYLARVSASASHRPSTVVQALFAVVIRMWATSPPSPIPPPTPEDAAAHPDYWRIVALLSAPSEGNNDFTLDAAPHFTRDFAASNEHAAESLYSADVSLDGSLYSSADESLYSDDAPESLHAERLYKSYFTNAVAEQGFEAAEISVANATLWWLPAELAPLRVFEF
ncbi:hypothetical protein T484DRAFT_1862356, partial [Baffinella frigidus]